MSLSTTTTRLQWATGKCNYGNFCGQGCPTPGTDPMPTPVDDLDEFCQTHDGCFGTDDPCEKCKCHAALIAGTQQVCLGGRRCLLQQCNTSLSALPSMPFLSAGTCTKASSYNRHHQSCRTKLRPCSFAQPTLVNLAGTTNLTDNVQRCPPPLLSQVLKNADCYEDNWASGRCQDKAKVREAPTIALGISVQAIKDGCLAFAWGDDCLSSSSSSASSESSEPASSSSSSTQSYRYTYTLATSCDSGSGTDGAVQVKITDKE